MTPEKIAALNAEQRAGRFHPMTCPGNHSHCNLVRELVATPDGWLCQCGQYRQPFGLLPPTKEPTT